MQKSINARRLRTASTVMKNYIKVVISSYFRHNPICKTSFLLLVCEKIYFSWYHIHLAFIMQYVETLTKFYYKIILPGISTKKYTKLIKRKLKLKTFIINLELFLNSTESNLNFELSFVGIPEVF